MAIDTGNNHEFKLGSIKFFASDEKAAKELEQELLRRMIDGTQQAGYPFPIVVDASPMVTPIGWLCKRHNVSVRPDVEVYPMCEKESRKGQKAEIKE